MCKVYNGYHGTSEIEDGLCACTVDNPLPIARGLSLHNAHKRCSICHTAGPRSAIGRAPDSYVRGPGFDTRSGNILSFLLPLFQEGQLSVTGESMCTKYWLTA